MINFKTLNSPPLGLTLIEILIVVTIIGILASVIVPNLMKKPDQARVVAAKQGISSLVQALQIYKLDNNYYPTVQQGLQALIDKPTLSPETPNWSGPYIDRLRNDPWGNKYLYLRIDFDEGIEVVSYGADKKIGGEGINADIYSSRF